MTKSTTRVAADLQTFTQAEITAKDVVAKAGRRNLIINGAMQVSQRGGIDSSSAAAHVTYQIDRWRTVSDVAATIQRKVEQTLPTGERVNTLNITMSATGYAALQQRVEDYIYLRGKTVILSMWVKSNVSAGMSIYDGLSQPFAVPHSGNGEWEYITVAHSCPTNTSDMRAELWTKYPVSADAYIEIANVQLEVGSVATPFEHRSYGEELALCQRYYQRVTGKFTSQGTRWAGEYFGSYYMPVTMRSAPAFLGSRPAMLKAFGAGAALDSTAVVAGEAGISSIELQMTGGSVGTSAFLRFGASTDWFSLDAEL